MKEVTFDKFMGLAPKFGSSVPAGYATVAENVDLVTGKIRQLAESERVIPSNDQPYNSFQWMIDGIPTEIFLDTVGNTLKKRVGSFEAPVGQPLPNIPISITSLSSKLQLRESPYLWTKSTAAGAYWEYYCTLAGGADPGLSKPDKLIKSFTGLYRTRITVPTMELPEMILGSLQVDQWAYGDNDSAIAFNTIYVRVKEGRDPDTISGLNLTAVFSPGNVSGSVKYFYTYLRNVGGHVDESGPSALSAEYTADYEILRIQMPAITEPYITHWRLYRISNATGEYQRVGEWPIDTLTMDDNLLDADLSGQPESWYTSSQGNEILFQRPQVAFHGLITRPHAGMCFAHYDNVLMWCEPGKPDGWTELYSMNFPSAIKRVFPVMGALAVLTESGPFRVDGTHPELLQQSDVLGTKPAISMAAYNTNLGIVYLTDTGIALFNMVNVSVITDSHFASDWFSENIDPMHAQIVESDRKIYLHDQSKCLVGDFREVTKPLWTTRSLSESDAEAWTWRSGDLNGGSRDTRFEEVEIMGTGNVTISLFLDDLNVREKQMNLDGMLRGRIAKIPDGLTGRNLQVQMSGTSAQVDQMTVRFN